MNTVLFLEKHFDTFAGNGTKGEEFRVKHVEPLWETHDEITLDFHGVDMLTHSFVNALIGNIVENHPHDFQVKLRFRNCNEVVTSFIKGALAYGVSRSRKAEAA